MALKRALAVTLVIPAVALAASLGKPRGPFTPREELIVGGTKADAGEFPYIVSLAIGGSHACGGVLLNANTVLTAGHCSVDTDPSDAKVRAGSLLWASGGTQSSVSEIVTHPDYQASTTDNDIGLWHLSSPIDTSSVIGYVELPEQGEDPAPGSTATVAGWGLTSENGSTLPANLMKVSVPIVSRADCRAEYGSSAVTDNMVCAGLEQGGKDSCSGDSGGPIVDAETGTLTGLVSWGQGCAEAGYAGVYVRVGNYVDYINSNKWTS